MLSHPTPASSPALRRLLPCLALLCLCALGHAANANTLSVPSASYPTIQAAVNASMNGDTVLLADGTYTGPGNVDVDFGGRNLVVTSQNGAASTIIDCGGFSSTDNSGDHRGFYLHSGETSAVISGLTVKNGYESGNGSSNGYGGGIEVDNATVTVYGCVLQNDTAQVGGGFFNTGGTATLTNDTFTGDTAQFYGGGLYNNGAATLTNDTFTDDTAGDYGGGFDNDTNGTATLTNDIFYGDTAQDGGEVYYYGGTVSASHCDIAEALGSGGDGVTDDGGNINADPKFINPPGDLHLQPSSPCAGAGTPNGAPATDKDGHPRSDPPTIGAYEDILYVSPSGSDSNPGTQSAPFLTIQAAINAASNGDTVLLADGTYTGPGDVDVDFGGKNITVTSQDGAAKTVIDCGGSYSANHRGFILQRGEANAVISGLTIQNGNESSDGNGGGGIEVLNATVTVQNCVLQNNGVDSRFGGGLYNVGALTLTDCAFTGNSAGAGGGLYSGGALTLTNCAFTGDTAAYGGGLFNDGGGTAALTNCTFTGNTAYDGGGLYNYGTVTLTNDILYGDTTQYDPEVYNNNNGTASAMNCDIQGGLPSGVTDDGGNISADPLFINPPADLHLQPGSPCLGAGTPNGAPAVDKDGTVRPNPPSIGAYDTPTTLTSSLNPSLKGQSVTFTAHVAANAAGTPTGSITFTVDGTAQTPVTLDASGNAAFTTSALAVGTHTVTVSYSGDAIHISSGSATLTQTVNPAYQVYAVNASGPAGQTVLLSAALLQHGGMGLSGATLTFSVDGTAVGSAVTGRNGIAGFHYAVPPTLPLGAHTITASFAGDGTNPASSGTATLTVTKAHTALTVASVSGVAGQTVTLSVTLKSGPSGIPGETVSFSVGSAVVGMATTDKSGVAMLPYTISAGSAAGSQPITVTFAGDSSYAAGTGQGTLTVKSSTALAVANVAGSRGTTVTLSASLTSGGSGLSGKSVSFKVDGKAVGAATTDGTGTASLSYAIPSSDQKGAHSVAALFAGDGADTPSSGKGTLTVQ